MKRINKTWMLIIVLIILTAILLAASFMIKDSKAPSPTPTPVKTAQKEASFTKLEISSEPQVSTISGRYTVDVNMNTDQNEVTVTQLELSYNPNILRVFDINPGSLIENPEVLQKNIDPETGRISYWIASGSSKGFVQGSGTIATITFRKVGTGSAQITFEPKTSVRAIGADDSVLKQALPAIINSLPTPSPLPTNSFTPTSGPGI